MRLPALGAATLLVTVGRALPQQTRQFHPELIRDPWGICNGAELSKISDAVAEARTMFLVAERRITTLQQSLLLQPGNTQDSIGEIDRSLLAYQVLIDHTVSPKTPLSYAQEVVLQDAVAALRYLVTIESGTLWTRDHSSNQDRSIYVTCGDSWLGRTGQRDVFEIDEPTDPTFDPGRPSVFIPNGLPFPQTNEGFAFTSMTLEIGRNFQDGLDVYGDNSEPIETTVTMNRAIVALNREWLSAEWDRGTNFLSRIRSIQKTFPIKAYPAVELTTTIVYELFRVANIARHDPLELWTCPEVKTEYSLYNEVVSHVGRGFVTKDSNTWECALNISASSPLEAVRAPFNLFYLIMLLNLDSFEHIQEFVDTTSPVARHGDLRKRQIPDPVLEIQKPRDSKPRTPRKLRKRQAPHPILGNWRPEDGVPRTPSPPRTDPGRPRQNFSSFGDDGDATPRPRRPRPATVRGDREISAFERARTIDPTIDDDPYDVDQIIYPPPNYEGRRGMGVADFDPRVLDYGEDPESDTVPDEFGEYLPNVAWGKGERIPSEAKAKTRRPLAADDGNESNPLDNASPLNPLFSTTPARPRPKRRTRLFSLDGDFYKVDVGPGQAGPSNLEEYPQASPSEVNSPNAPSEYEAQNEIVFAPTPPGPGVIPSWDRGSNSEGSDILYAPSPPRSGESPYWAQQSSSGGSDIMYAPSPPRPGEIPSWARQSSSQGSDIMYAPTPPRAGHVPPWAQPRSGPGSGIASDPRTPQRGQPPSWARQSSSQGSGIAFAPSPPRRGRLPSRVRSANAATPLRASFVPPGDANDPTEWDADYVNGSDDEETFANGNARGSTTG